VTRIGLFLGVSPAAGGMFQYAQAMAAALEACMPRERLLFAYVDPEWQPILERHAVDSLRLPAGRLSLWLANAIMAMRLPGKLARWLGYVNPMFVAMRRAGDLWIFPAQDAAGYQLDRPAIVTVHDLMHRYEPHFPEVANTGRRKIRDHRFANLIDWAQAVLVDSETGKHHVVESYGADPDTIFSLPYVPSPHVVGGEEPSDFEQRFPLPAKFLFYPAQFWEHKNHRRLLEAVAVVSAQAPDLFLVCTGSHAHAFPDLVQRARELEISDQILFPGYVPDAYLGGFYRRARALVMPTFFGPTNIPPLEAFAYGCPVAISDKYGMPEQAGNAALLFNPASVASIANAIRRLWTDDALCADLSRKGLRRSRAWQPLHFKHRLRAILEEVRKAQPRLG